MRHRVAGNKLSKTPAHRKAMFRNMLTALFRYERITTTRAKAKALRPIAEKMLTRARVPSLHNRRIVARDIHDKAILHKLFTVIAPRFITRPGGYTRILKLGQRTADSTEMVLIELVERTEKEGTKDGTKESAAAEKAIAKSKKEESKKDKSKKKEQKVSEEPLSISEETKSDEPKPEVSVVADDAEVSNATAGSDTTDNVSQDK